VLGLHGICTTCGEVATAAESDDLGERMADRAEVAGRAMATAQVTVDGSGSVVDVRPAEMTPDRGPDVGTTHHAVTDDTNAAIAAFNHDDAEIDEDWKPEPSKLIPAAAKFGTAPYLDAPSIADLAERLIESKEALGDLADLRIVYRWKAKGGTSKGWPKLAGIERVSGQTLAFIAGPAPDLLVWLAADTLRESAVTERQIEAILFDQLVSVEWSDGDEDGDPTWRLVGPEVMCHLATLEEYGAFTRKLESAKAAFIQPSLFEASIAVDERFTQEEAERVIKTAQEAYDQMRADEQPADDGLDAV
jgi:hypothetical protein